MNDGLIKEIKAKKIPRGYLLLKRCMDILISFMLLPVVVPLLSIVFFIVCMTSGCPILFKQKRVGLEGRVFTIYKIRTMIYNGSNGYWAYTVKNDKRITAIGAILRKLKIDELPQLLNVIRGEMSLVGPRPERIEIVNICKRQNKYYHIRHLVKPGMTGWAQVNKPVATPLDNFQKLSYDLYYIYNYSILLEMKIVFRTIGIILSMKGL